MSRSSLSNSAAGSGNCAGVGGRGWAPLAVGVALALSILAESVVAADEDPLRWLEDMERAFFEQRYDGVFTFYSGRELTTLRVVHMHVDGEPRERLIHMNGAPREILRQGTEITYRIGADDSLQEVLATLTGGPLTAAFVRDFAAISNHYELRAAGSDRIAGRPARRFLVEPRDDNRHGYRLWLDEPSRLLLRSEMVDGRGQRLEIFQFTQVTIGAEVDASALEPAAPAAEVSELTLDTKTAQKSAAAPSQWMPTWLPPGFVRVTAVAHGDKAASSVSTRLFFSDGLADFSVFIEPETHVGHARVPALLESRSGGTVTLSRLRQFPGAGQTPLRFTLVGEIPLATARRILDSLASVASASAHVRNQP